MSSRREIRELALQALYQYEVRGEVDIEAIERSILDAPQAEAAKRQALEMAGKAWAMHEQADALGSELSPDWPTHRQPLVDRSILRLGFYEIASGLTPTAVAINEAVELAKAYGSQRSPPFINGVLDKMSRHLHDRGTIAAPPADGWLDEAMRDSRPLS
jgi:transcription antitermination protein NusB